jgi:hypothetical protein
MKRFMASLLFLSLVVAPVSALAQARAAAPTVGAPASVVSRSTTDISGCLPLPSSPATGTLTPPSPSSDVWSVYLSAGQTLSVYLTGTTGTDFDVMLYAPGTATVVGATPVASSTAVAYPNRFTYRALTSGTFYVQVAAALASGPGDYSLAYGVDGDSQIPGVALPATPVTGSLDNMTDPYDVYRVPVAAGHAFAVSLYGPAGANFDLFLYRPGSPTIFKQTGYVVAKATGATYPDSLVYTVPTGKGGTYYLMVRATTGSGAYTLSWRDLHFIVKLSVSTRSAAVNKSIRVTGSVSPSSVSKFRVVQMQEYYKGKWGYFWKPKLNKYGKFSGYIWNTIKQRAWKVRLYMPKTGLYPAAASSVISIRIY